MASEAGRGRAGDRRTRDLVRAADGEGWLAVRRLRPHSAGVGFYGYPDHTYYYPEHDVAKNNAQMPVFAASTALRSPDVVFGGPSRIRDTQR